MPFYTLGDIKYYKFSTLDVPGIYHAIYTRHGGISPTPWESLNFGASVGDQVNRVQQNRIKALDTMKVSINSVYDVYQVHSTNIITAKQPLLEGESHQKADGIITNIPGLTLMMRFADCVPILLFDTVHQAVGIIHAGWMGTVNKIVEKAIKIMVSIYHTNPNDVIAGLGPSIGPDHYQIRNDVLERIKRSFGIQADQFITNRHGKIFFDLWKANQYLLHQSGVGRIEISGICTFCHMDDWYSHRGEHGITGRFGAVIGIEGIGYESAALAR